MTIGIISASALTKSYGKRRGVIGLDLEVREGEIFGYLGPNGAGKTTTIRLLLDLIRPTGGDARIFDMDVHDRSLEIRRDIGYLGGELSLYGNLTGNEMVSYVGNIRGGIDRNFVAELADRFRCDLSVKIMSLSHGNKQKIGLILAFMNRPRLLLLDEPTQGLDPLMQQEFYGLLLDVRKDGRTVFLSSHIMYEVERVCDRVGIIRDGSIVDVESIDVLKDRALRRLEIRFAEPVSIQDFENVPGVRDLTLDGRVLMCNVVGSVDAIVKAASRFEVSDLISDVPDLEEIFLSYYSGNTANV